MTTPKHEPVAFWAIRGLDSYSNEEFSLDLSRTSAQRRRKIFGIGTNEPTLASQAQKASLLAYMMLWDLLRTTYGINEAPLFEYPSDGFVTSRSGALDSPVGQSRTNHQAQKFHVGKGVTGKPRLKDHPDVHFNLSHTENAALAVVANDPVGADVQSVHDPKPALVERALSQAERQALSKLDDHQRALAFAEIWTQKEAFLKLQGTGIQSIEALRNLEVPPSHLVEKGCSIEEGFAWCICAKPGTKVFLPLSN